MFSMSNVIMIAHDATYVTSFLIIRILFIEIIMIEKV